MRSNRLGVNLFMQSLLQKV